MSRKAVRTVVSAFFQPDAVAGLNQVTRAKVRNLKPGAFYSLGAKTGAVAWVYVEGEHEHRIAAPTVTGHKQVTYTVGLRVEFHSLHPDNDAGIDAFDDVIDGIKARLRSDPLLGTNGSIVFQAGEGDTADATDIVVISDDARQEGDTTKVDAVVQFVVVEILTA